MKYLAKLALLAVRAARRLSMLSQRSLFRACGQNVIFGHGCDFSYENIEIGDDVYIGPHACFMSAISRIYIGNKVLIGPNVTIMGGDHRTNVIGAYMYDVKEKLPENDVDVIIEDDVWIGSNVLILKGVRISRGSIVGGGSVVTKDVPPYSVHIGRPEHKLRPRWDAATISEHEQLLKLRSRS